jgi:hypothetical protein
MLKFGGGCAPSIPLVAPPPAAAASRVDINCCGDHGFNHLNQHVDSICVQIDYDTVQMFDTLPFWFQQGQIKHLSLMSPFRLIRDFISKYHVNCNLVEQGLSPFKINTFILKRASQCTAKNFTQKPSYVPKTS